MPPLPLPLAPWFAEEDEVARFTDEDVEDDDAAASWSLEDLPRVRTLAVFLVVCLEVVPLVVVDVELPVACGEGECGTSFGDNRPSSGTLVKFLPEDR